MDSGLRLTSARTTHVDGVGLPERRADTRPARAKTDRAERQPARASLGTFESTSIVRIPFGRVVTRVCARRVEEREAPLVIGECACSFIARTDLDEKSTPCGTGYREQCARASGGAGCTLGSVRLSDTVGRVISVGHPPPVDVRPAGRRKREEGRRRKEGRSVHGDRVCIAPRARCLPVCRL